MTFSRTVLTAVAVVLPLLFSGCAREELQGATTEKAIPPWIVSVEPAPGKRAEALKRIEVQHRVMTGGESVRLEVDGTDVTSYADFGREDLTGGPGLLVYDAEAASNFVPLDQGEHTATVTRVRLTGIGEQHEVLDSFTWGFTVQ